MTLLTKVFSIILIFTSIAWAGPAIDTLAVQGYMKRANGTAVTDGTYQVAIGVFQNSVAIWGVQTPITVTNGLFSKNLSGGGSNLSTLPGTTGMNSNFVGIDLLPTLLRDAGIGPVRIRIYAIDPINGSQPQFDITTSSVPTAYIASIAQNVVPGSITAASIASTAKTVISSGTISDAGKIPLLDGLGILDTSVIPDIPASKVTGSYAVAANSNFSMTSGTGTFSQAFTGTTTTANSISASALTSGAIMSISSSNAASTGNALVVSSNSTGAQANGIARFNFTGDHTGNGFQIDDVTTTGTVASITGSALTSGRILSVSSTNAPSTGNAFVVTSNSTGTQTNGIAHLNFTGAHGGNGLQIDDATATGTVAAISAPALTTGSILSVSSSNAASTGNALLVSSNSTGAATNGIARLNFSGAHTGNGLQIDDATATGTVAAISASALTTGSIFSISSSNASSTGNALLLSSNTTGLQVNGIARLNFTGAHTGNGLQIDDVTTTGTAAMINANSATTGRALTINGNGLTSGSLVGIASTSTAAASNTQTLLNIALSGANATASQTTYGAQISNTHTGATSTNVGLSVTASGGTTANYAAIFTGNVGMGTTTPATALTVAGPISLQQPPAAINSATHTVAVTASSLIFTTTNCTVTLPAAATFPGRILWVKTVTANSVASASANVQPIGSVTPGTAILAATAGRWAMLQSNGTHWIVMAAN